jgi:hypothetical protein
MLVSIVILGIAGVAILAGVEMTVKSSDLGRKQASGGSYVRSLAEVIQNSVQAGGYSTACASYVTPAAKTAAGIPSTYTVQAAPTKVWNGSGWVGCPGTPDNGTQQITLTVTSSGSGAHQAIETLTMIVRKPCTGPVPAPGSQTVKPC